MANPRREAALKAAAERRSRERFFIQFDYKPREIIGRRHGRDIYRRAVWPKLFMTRDDAWAYLELVPRVFFNGEAQPDRPRLMSCSVEKVTLPAKEATDGQT